jgi:o-succinylbenzoate synthase
MVLVTSVRALPENLELREPYSIASGTQTEANYVVVVVEDEDGNRGIGEASPMPGYSDETQESILSAITKRLAPAVTGDEVSSVNSAVEAMDEAAENALMAKSAVEMALTDLSARKRGVSVVEYLGGAIRNEVGVACGIGFMDQKAAAEKAKRFVESGVTTLKVKIGRSSEEDEGLVGIVRSAAGKDASLRLDANQAYRADNAIVRLRRLERFEPELFEQPIDQGDVRGMARIAKALDTPIMADEPIHGVSDVVRFANADAADLVKVKLNKCGGFKKTGLVCEVARMFGIRVIIGSGHESSIGVAAEVSLAMTNSNFDSTGEMNGNQRLKTEWVRKRLLPERGRISLSGAHGLGVEVRTLAARFQGRGRNRRASQTT